MEQIAEQITHDLLNKLPDKIQFFTRDELISSGIPSVVVKILRKKAENRIESEISIPESEWFKSDQKDVKEAWQNFIDVSKQNLRFSATKLPEILLYAVQECLELTLKPRKSVCEFLFQDHETVDYNTLKNRVEKLDVNKQLGIALLKYMKKKEIDELTFEKAGEVIKKVDQRLVESYHPLNWARALQPVFNLAGPSVDSDLFRIFFEDKGKIAYAREFDFLETSLTETEFIEKLSSADLLDVEAYDEDQPALFVPEKKEKSPEKVVEIERTMDEENVRTFENEDDESDNEIDLNEEHSRVSEEREDAPDHDQDDIQPSEPVKDETGEKKNVDKKDTAESEEERDEENDETIRERDTYQAIEVEDEKNEIVEKQKERKENIVDLFSKMEDEELFDEDDDHILSLVGEHTEDEDENISLLSRFMFDESVEDPTEKSEEQSDTSEASAPEEPSSIYEEMNLVKEETENTRKESQYIEDPSNEDQESEEDLSFKIDENQDTGESRENESVFTVEDNADEEDQPMWRSFLERDDLETESGYEYEEESDIESDEEDGFIEEPIYDLTTEEENPEEKIRKISSWLDDEKDRFVEEIFKGSETAYEQAILEIMDFENWKKATIYLEQEVFSRNKVDVYDEAAVDFTDRLHSYFLENN